MIYGTLPCAMIISLNPDASMVTIVISDILRLIQLGCVSQDRLQRKSILRENGKLGTNHTAKFSKTTMRRVKNLGTEGSIAGNHSTVRNPYAPKFEEKIKTKP